MAVDAGLLACALEYARLGLAVYPIWGVLGPGRCACPAGAACSHAGNHPCPMPGFEHGFKDATRDPEKIEAWVASRPETNIGIATGTVSGVVVVDIDARHGGFESWLALEDEAGPCPVTWAVASGGGGRHLYFSLAPGERLPTTTIRPGVEIKAEGGCITAPPSLHRSGKRYAWEEGRAPEECARALRTPILAAPVKSLGKGVQPGGNGSPAAAVPVGQRHSVMVQWAGRFCRMGVHGDELFQFLQIKNAINEIPLTDGEIRSIAKSAKWPAAPQAEPEVIQPTPKPKLDNWLNLWDLLEKDLPPRPSYIGEFIPAGCVTLLVAAAGAGKTFLMLQGAISVELGIPWLGFPTTRAHTAILELENDERDLQPRLRSMWKLIQASGVQVELPPRPIEAFTPDQLLTSRFNLLKKENQEAIVEWLLRDKIECLFIDTFERLHSGAENQDIQPLIAVLEEIARRTGAAIVVLHHERKPLGKSNGETRVDDMNAIRGSTVLAATAKVVMRLVDMPGTELRQLRWAKVNLGKTPELIWLRQDEAGIFHVAEEPRNPQVVKGEANRAAVAVVLRSAGAKGIGAKEGASQAAANTGKTMDARTFRNWAIDLGAKSTGQGRSTVWVMDPQLYLESNLET